MPRHFVTEDHGPACGVPYKAIVATYDLNDVTCHRCQRTRIFAKLVSVQARTWELSE
jgi:hypothetical protein